ncbi:MAG TPA: transglycosylase domain-containing protein, partial [Elusimicrobiota bacterium]|nr:transglycosylase domain-containing protein [Elusimicrobiota bacterium]
MGRRDAFRKITVRGPRALRVAAASLGGFALLSIAALPRPLFREPTSTVLLGRDGGLLAAKIAADQQWRFPALDRVPAKFKIAAIQFEDRRFERHWGVDPFAVARALREAVRRRRVTSGASTLSMQVIRLARGNPPRTVPEKIWEMFLALGLELTHSKERVLSLYAAHAPMGGNIVGLEAASWRYFGRAPESLSWAEAGVLAVLPNSPALMHPGRNRDRLRAKRDRLLNRLHAAGFISDSDWPLALAEPLPDAPLPLPAHA